MVIVAEAALSHCHKIDPVQPKFKMCKANVIDELSLIMLIEKEITRELGVNNERSIEELSGVMV